MVDPHEQPKVMVLIMYQKIWFSGFYIMTCKSFLNIQIHTQWRESTNNSLNQLKHVSS